MNVQDIGLPKNEVDTPFLWVDLDILEENIRQMAARCAAAGVNWRPHIKGIKTPAIAHMLLRAGAIGLTCAKVGEAEVMAAAGVQDMLIANQIVGERKYTRLADLVRTADVKVAVDSTATLAGLDAAARAKGVVIGLVIEVDSGMNRAGVQPGAPAAELAKAIDAYPGLTLRGLMSWEGHTLSVEDPVEKRAEIRRAIDKFRASVDACREAGFPVEIVSCGGSGTYDMTVDEVGITEIQAGGALFRDMFYPRMAAPTQHALYVHSAVTSRPTPERIIIDAGFKTLPRWSGLPKAVGMAGVADMVMSAEHGIITLEAPNEEISVGDRFDFIPGYGDITVFLHSEIYAIRNGTVEAVWPIAARGMLR